MAEKAEYAVCLLYALLCQALWRFQLTTGKVGVLALVLLYCRITRMPVRMSRSDLVIMGDILGV